MYETSIVGKTKQGIPIFRIDFEDGNWWELHGERTWGTGQAIRVATVGLDSSIAIEAIQMKHATNMAALINSTVGWSWDDAQTPEAIESLPEVEVQIASRELATRHLSLLMGVEEPKKKSWTWKWPWLQVRRSPKNTGAMYSNTRAR